MLACTGGQRILKMCCTHRVQHSSYGSSYTATPMVRHLASRHGGPGVQPAAAVSRNSTAAGCSTERSRCTEQWCRSCRTEEQCHRQHMHGVPAEDLLVSERVLPLKTVC